MNDQTFEDYLKNGPTLPSYAKSLQVIASESLGNAMLSWKATIDFANVLSQGGKEQAESCGRDVWEKLVPKASANMMSIRLKLLLKQFQVVNENLQEIVNETNHIVERSEALTTKEQAPCER